MEITEVEVLLLELPLTEPFVASHGTTTVRTVSIVRVTGPDGEGWGECSALPAATYTAESAVGGFRTLVDDLAPALVTDHATVGNDPTDPIPLHPALAIADDRPMARSAAELAILDAALTARGRSLADWLAGPAGPGVPDTVAAGVSLGLDTVERTVAAVGRLADEGYRRCKVKVEPGHDVDLVAAVANAVPGLAIHADANGAFRPTGRTDPVTAVLAIAEAGASSLEQPFPPEDRANAARLIAELDRAGSAVPVVADEAVASVADFEAVTGAGAMTGLSIKPGRVGGVTVARDLHDRCLAAGVVATAGGMLETGLGRHALAALAALPGFALTGDLSPAGRWLAADPWPDLTLADGRLTVPGGPGVAPPPDQDVVAGHLIDRALIRRR
ncbi:MAG: enolase C-terminal domain-like protein [Actinomycetota bacterium]